MAGYGEPSIRAKENALSTEEERARRFVIRARCERDECARKW